MSHNFTTKILLVCTLAILLGCNSVTSKMPAGILSKQQMVEVITDLQLLDAAQKKIVMPGMQALTMMDTSYIIVYNKHQTNLMQFDSSMRVYTQHPAIFSDIMEQVAQKLNSTK